MIQKWLFHDIDDRHRKQKVFYKGNDFVGASPWCFSFHFLNKIYIYFFLMIRYNIFFYLISENFNFIYHVYISYDLIDHYTKRIREIKYSIREVYFLFVIRTNFWKLIHSFIYATVPPKSCLQKSTADILSYHVRWHELFFFFLEKAPYIYMRTNLDTNQLYAINLSAETCVQVPSCESETYLYSS